MADLTVTAAQVAPVNEVEPVITTMIAAAAITAGQIVYENTSAKADLARANATGTTQTIRGVALQSVAAGRPVNVIERGAVYGFGGLGNSGTTVYASAATAGAIADTAPTTPNFLVPVGTVRSMPEGPNGATMVKVLYVNVNTSHVTYVAL